MTRDELLKVLEECQLLPSGAIRGPMLTSSMILTSWKRMRK